MEFKIKIDDAMQLDFLNVNFNYKTIFTEINEFKWFIKLSFIEFKKVAS